MTREDIIRMAREAGLRKHIPFFSDTEVAVALHNFAEMVRADEREKYKWEIHSCGPTCKRYACVATREAVAAEREACAQMVMPLDESLADAIRARGQA